MNHLSYRVPNCLVFPQHYDALEVFPGSGIGLMLNLVQKLNTNKCG